MRAAVSSRAPSPSRRSPPCLLPWHPAPPCDWTSGTVPIGSRMDGASCHWPAVSPNRHLGKKAGEDRRPPRWRGEGAPGGGRGRWSNSPVVGSRVRARSRRLGPRPGAPPPSAVGTRAAGREKIARARSAVSSFLGRGGREPPRWRDETPPPPCIFAVDGEEALLIGKGR